LVKPSSAGGTAATGHGRANSEWEIFDLDSLNGTVVDSVKIRHAFIKPGSRIVFGAGAGIAVGERWRERPSRLAFVCSSAHCAPHDKTDAESEQALPAKRPQSSSRAILDLDSKRPRLSPIPKPSSRSVSQQGDGECLKRSTSDGAGGRAGSRQAPGGHVYAGSFEASTTCDEAQDSEDGQLWKEIPSIPDRCQREQQSSSSRGNPAGGCGPGSSSPKDLQQCGHGSRRREPAARQGVVETFHEDVTCPICQV
jgi:hypothetical protein